MVVLTKPQSDVIHELLTEFPGSYVQLSGTSEVVYIDLHDSEGRPMQYAWINSEGEEINHGKRT